MESSAGNCFSESKEELWPCPGPSLSLMKAMGTQHPQHSSTGPPLLSLTLKTLLLYDRAARPLLAEEEAGKDLV